MSAGTTGGGQEQTAPRRVVVLDDHAMLRDSVSRALENAGFEVVGGASTPEEAVSLVRIHRPDLLLADVNLGDGNDGIEVAAAARGEHEDLKVVVVSMHDDERTVKRALEAGVSGFVSKDAPLSELLDGVRTVMDGSSYLSPRLAAKVMDLLSGRATTGPASLTDREAEILALLASGSRTSEIAETLFLAEKTVKNHLTSVYSKLGVNSAAQAVAEAHRLGLARPV